MSCNGTLFSLDDLNGESVENEMFISDHCVSNTIKMTAFILHFLINGIVGIGGLAILFVYNLWWIEEGSRRWNAFNRTFLGAVITCFCNMGRLLFFITGTASRWKYLLFPFQYIFVLYTTIDVGYCWFNATIARHGITGASGDEDRKYKLFINIVIAWTIIGSLVFGGIGPVIAFDNPWIVNWFYCIMLVYVYTLALSIGSAYIHVGHKLLRVLETWKKDIEVVNPGDHISEEIPKLAKGINIVVFLTKSFMLPVLLLSIFPIVWISLTQTADEPGMQYFFYVQFFFVECLPIVSIACQTYFQFNLPHNNSRNNTSQNKKGSDNGSGKEKKSHTHRSSAAIKSTPKRQSSHEEFDESTTKFSFTVTELTGSNSSRQDVDDAI